MKNLMGFAAALLVSTSVASASSVQLFSDDANSTEGLGSFEGTMDFDGASLLTITLKNTSSGPGLTTAKITGFVFNALDSVNATFVDANDLSTSGFDESAFNNTDSESASPFGDYDEGAALGGSWLGGGSPNAGIDIGETGIFQFLVTGGAGLDVLDFFTTDQGATDFEFAVRFRGIDAGAGSDKVPALIGRTSTAIPLPPAVWSGLATLGAMGAVTVRRSIRSLIGV
jgi:hypothetical protein